MATKVPQSFQNQEPQYRPQIGIFLLGNPHKGPQFIETAISFLEASALNLPDINPPTPCKAALNPVLKGSQFYGNSQPCIYNYIYICIYVCIYLSIYLSTTLHPLQRIPKPGKACLNISIKLRVGSLFDIIQIRAMVLNFWQPPYHQVEVDRMWDL